MSETARYGCIISDPAWRYKDTNARAAAEKHYKADESTGRATMSLAEIIALPVERLTADDAHLWLWTTAAHEPAAHSVMAYWGFTFIQHVVWVKTNDIETIIEPQPDGTFKIRHVITDAYKKKLLSHKTANEVPRISLTIGTGHYMQHASETLLFGRRGSCVSPVGGVPNVFFAPRDSAHSAKPPIVHQLAELISPGPRLEMFARRERPGWSLWGNEAPNSIELPDTAHVASDPS